MKFVLSHLSIGYQKDHSVLSDINAEVESGRLTCLIGKNGIGKSTLLKTISGFLPPLSGHIFLDNTSLSSLSHKELSHKISVVLTTKPDIRKITAYEMVGMGRAPYTGFFGTLNAQDKEIVTKSLRAVGIEHLSERMIDSLSDGERQKVMIAKALAQATPIILLDEPTAFLDFHSKADIFRLLHEKVVETNKIILLSTHDLELAVRFADTLLEVSEQGLRLVSNREVKKEIAGLLKR